VARWRREKGNPLARRGRKTTVLPSEGEVAGLPNGLLGLAPQERKIVRGSIELYDIPDGLVAISVAISWPALCGSRCSKRSRQDVLLGLRTGGMKG
jgi:hypothetical protein